MSIMASQVHKQKHERSQRELLQSRQVSRGQVEQPEAQEKKKQLQVFLQKNLPNMKEKPCDLPLSACS